MVAEGQRYVDNGRAARASRSRRAGTGSWRWRCVETAAGSPGGPAVHGNHNDTLRHHSSRNTHTHKHTHTHTRTHARTHARTQTRDAYTRAQTHTRARAHTHTHHRHTRHPHAARKHTHTHTHTLTFIQEHWIHATNTRARTRAHTRTRTHTHTHTERHNCRHISITRATPCSSRSS